MRRATAFSALGLLTMGLVVGVAAPASAHNYLVSSTPSDGGVLTALPDEFIITTNDELLDLGADSGGFGLQVQDTDGRYYGDGCVAVDGPSMTAAAALGDAGDYLLTWQVVSVDGHTVSGEIPFAWTPDDDAEISEGSATAPVCGQEVEEPTAPSEEAEDKASPPATVDEEPADSGDLLWIAAAIAAVVVAAGTTMLVLGRAKK
ncbi:MAG: copper resistance CopC family protein [Homoserinimonas sp.]